MTSDAYELADAVEALNEKCLEGYRIAIYFDPTEGQSGTSWITWRAPDASANAEAGRGLPGSVFDRKNFCESVRQLVLDIDRIRSLRKFAEGAD